MERTCGNLWLWEWPLPPPRGSGPVLTILTLKGSRIDQLLPSWNVHSAAHDEKDQFFSFCERPADPPSDPEHDSSSTHYIALIKSSKWARKYLRTGYNVFSIEYVPLCLSSSTQNKWWRILYIFSVIFWSMLHVALFTRSSKQTWRHTLRKVYCAVYSRLIHA
jgi:hypothetical protein